MVMGGVFNPWDGGTRADTAATGAVTTTDTAYAYIKQLVTLVLAGKGLAFRGPIASGSSTTAHIITSLAGLGANYFNDEWFLFCAFDAADGGAAPQGEIRQITDYTDAGTFTTTAFTAATATGDVMIAVHRSAIGLLGVIHDITDPVDMTIYVPDDSVLSNQLTVGGDTSDYDRRTDSQEAISDAVAEVKARQVILHQVECTEDEYALKNTNLDVFLADAIAGTIRNLVFEVYLELDAAATYTITISKTDALNPTTFTSVLIPSIATIATPAAAGRYRYEAGDLAQGQQCKFNIAQDDAGDAAHDIVATLTCEQ